MVHVDEIPIDIRTSAEVETNSIESVIEVVRSFVSKNYPSGLFSCLFGSYARGEQSQLSDVDFIIVLDDDSNLYLNQVVRDKILLQYATIGFSSVLRMMNAERNRSVAHILNCFKDSRYCVGSEYLFLFVKSKALSLLSMGPKPPNKYQLSILVRNVVNSYLKLVRNKEHYNKNFGIRLNLYQDLIILLQTNNGTWIENADRAYLNLHDDPTYKMLVASINLAPRDSVDSLIYITREYLSSTKQFLWEMR